MTGMEPFLIQAAIAAATTAAGVATSAMQSNAQQQQYAVQEAIARRQEQELKQRATLERAVSQTEARKERQKAEHLMSGQMAKFAASGGGVGGSATEVMAETAEQGQLNSEMALWQGEARAVNALNAGAVAGAEADALRDGSRAARKRLPWQIGSQIISGMGDVVAKMPARSSSSGAMISYDLDADSGWQTETRRGSGYRYG